MKRKQIPLPAEVYDTLHFAALANGGVGRGAFFAVEHPWRRSHVEATGGANYPVCALGLMHSAGIIDLFETEEFTSVTEAHGIHWSASDDVVAAWNNKKFGIIFGRERMPFRAWVRAMGIVRVEA